VKIDGRKTSEFREAARIRALARWTPEARAAQSVLTREKLKPAAMRERISNQTRAAMANPTTKARQVAGIRAAMSRPDVRARISEATRNGMARWHARLLDELRWAWQKAPKKIRTEFVAEIAARGCGNLHPSETTRIKFLAEITACAK
jgi:hypothetical protein